MGKRSLLRWTAAFAVVTQLLSGAPAFAQPAPAGDAKASLASADKAAKANDWAKAQADYRASHAAVPSAQAINGVANASYQLKAWGEAYEAYDEFLHSYKDAMGGGARALAEKRLKELEGKTGAVTILANESGADVFVDDHKIGTTPMRALYRVSSGLHQLKITKAGFAPYEKPIDVAVGAKMNVDANLAKEAKAGKVVIKEAGGQAVRVIIDGSDVGPATWEGELPPGTHEISLRSATLGSPTQKVDVEAGKTAEVSITATSATGHLEIKTSDGLGNIYVDGKLVGEGRFAADLPAGMHVVRVSREGFMPYEQRFDIVEKKSVSESVQLRREGQSVVAQSIEEQRPFYGLYGGFGVLGVTQIGGLGSSLDENDDSCKVLGAKSCDVPNPLGAGAFGYVGFTWVPVGVELFIGGLFDSVKQKAEFVYPGPLDPLAGPTRTEEFTFYRFGGIAAIRARATVDGRTFRASFAAGPGLSYKQMFMQRETSTPDGYKERYVPDDGKTNPGALEKNNFSYLSGALTGDVAVHWRMTPTTALSLGLLGWLETASNDVKSGLDNSRVLVKEGSTPIAIRTPPYELASGVQFFLGPYLGMMFGP